MAENRCGRTLPHEARHGTDDEHRLQLWKGGIARWLVTNVEQPATTLVALGSQLSAGRGCHGKPVTASLAHRFLLTPTDRRYAEQRQRHGKDNPEDRLPPHGERDGAPQKHLSDRGRSKHGCALRRLHGGSLGHGHNVQPTAEARHISRVPSFLSERPKVWKRVSFLFLSLTTPSGRW